MQFRSHIVINKPVHQAWRFFDNPANMPKWLTGFKEFHPLSGTPGQVGARAWHVYEVNGKRLEMEEELTRRVEQKELSGILTHPSMTSAIQTTFEQLDGSRTSVQCVVDVKFTAVLGRLFAPLIKGKFQQRQDADFKRLKECIEAES